MPKTIRFVPPFYEKKIIDAERIKKETETLFDETMKEIEYHRSQYQRQKELLTASSCVPTLNCDKHYCQLRRQRELLTANSCVPNNLNWNENDYYY